MAVCTYAFSVEDRNYVAKFGSAEREFHADHRRPFEASIIHLFSPWLSFDSHLVGSA